MHLSRKQRAPLLDADVLARIRALQSHEKPTILKRLIEAFSKNAPQLIEGIHAALAERNMEALRDKAHSFKSSSASLGALTLSDLWKKLEAAGHENRPKDAEALLEQIDAVYKRTLTEKLGVADQQPIIDVAGVQ